MVSKIAVIALVAIISVPILLGYAMNLDEVTVTDYKETGDSVNVTPLYQNGTGYTYANADIYSLNTDFLQVENGKVKVYPEYSTTNTKTSLPITKYTYTNGDVPPGRVLGDFNFIYLQYDYPASGGTLRVNLLWENATYSLHLESMHTFYWDSKTKIALISYYDMNLGLGTLRYASQLIEDPMHASVDVQRQGNYTGSGYYLRQEVALNTEASVDFSAGYFIKGLNVPETPRHYSSILNNNAVTLNLPNYPNNVLMTMDLNTISASDYSLIFRITGYGTFDEWYSLQKVTDSSGIHWTLNRIRATTLEVLEQAIDLYYDQSRLSNTYQIFIDNTGIEFRYVGNWPTLIGDANVYQSFKYDRDLNYYIGGMKKILFLTDTPKFRVDSSEYRAFEYPIIEDKSYTPSDFKTNPSTTISNVMAYGSSLVFGSNTYNINNGNIMIGTHKIPVNGIVLDSIPNGNGNYDNRINGTVVSESANPAAITFNGKWSASVSTIAQESYTYTKTEWVAGDFGWDGMDQNFLMVGLLASLGAFIALGIYARRSRASIWPLLIVCGGAALLFFVML